jgi:hypothetical protein
MKIGMYVFVLELFALVFKVGCPFVHSCRDQIMVAGIKFSESMLSLMHCTVCTVDQFLLTEI